MKTVKIFLASSEELAPERDKIADLVNNLNFKLRKQDISVQLVKWEYLDSSMGSLHKQEEYNRELRDCELCMVLYWTRFGMYTKTELDTAYSELCAGRNPRKLYVYFKDGDNISPELKAFRDGFPEKYGHFFCSFQNVDTLKADFLLQFMEYLNVHLKGNNLIEIKDSQVTIDGKVYVNLQNVPFAGNNEEYNLLVKSIKTTKRVLSTLERDDPDYDEYEKQLKDQEEKLKQKENSLWETAIMVTRLSTEKCSERLSRAIELFNAGNTEGARAVLKESEIEDDAQHNIRLIQLGEEGKIGLKTNIDEIELKIKILLSNTESDTITIYDEIERLLSKIIVYKGLLFGEESEEVISALLSARRLLSRHTKRIIPYYEQALAKSIKKYGENIEKVVRTRDKLCYFYKKIGDIDHAIKLKERKVELLLQTCGELSPSYCYSMLELGELKEQCSKDDAVLLYKKAIEISKAIDVESVIKAYDSLILLMYKNKLYDYAIAYSDELIHYVGEKYEKLSALLYDLAELGVSYTPRIMGYYVRSAELARKNCNKEEEISAYKGISKIFCRQRKFEKQIEYLKKILELVPNNESYQLNLAEAYIEFGEYPMAINISNNLLNQDKTGVRDDARVILYQALLCSGDYARAETLALDILKETRETNLDCFVIQALLRLIRFYRTTGNSDLVIKYINEALSLEVNHALKNNLLSSLAGEYYKLKEYSESEKIYQLILSSELELESELDWFSSREQKTIKRRIAIAYDTLAWFYCVTERYEESQKMLDMSYRYDEKLLYKERELWQSRIFQGQKRFDEAIAILEKVKSTYARHAESARIYCLMKDFDRAKQEAERAIEIDDNDPEGYEILGQIFQDIGDSSEAVRYYEKCLSLIEKINVPFVVRQRIRNIIRNRIEYNHNE